VKPSLVVSLRQKQIIKLIEKGKRLDGRSLDEYRSTKVEQGLIERAEGSARVLLGKTEVIVGVKLEIGKPFPDTPNEGVLTVNAELVPIASPSFEPGPPGEDAVELARVVDRGIRESKTVEVEKLCIEPGKKVFVIFIDVYIINHDGNLIDASALAAISALHNTKMFKYEIENDEVRVKPGYTQLPVRKHPITVTQVKINDKLIVDPHIKEEQTMTARVTFSIDDDDNICAIQKGGNGSFKQKEILEAAKTAIKKANEIRKNLKW
jgi:exosome complex component RRP42